MSAPAFCDGIQYFGEAPQGFEQYGKSAIAPGAKAVNSADAAAAYQVMLYSDALTLGLDLTAIHPTAPTAPRRHNIRKHSVTPHSVVCCLYPPTGMNDIRTHSQIHYENTI